MSAVARITPELTAWLDALRLALGARTASLWMLAPEGDRLTVALTRPADVADERDAIPLQGHALGWVVAEGVSLRASGEDIFLEADSGWVVAAPIAETHGSRVGCVVLEFEGVPRPDAARALELAAGLAGRLMSDVRAAAAAVRDLRKYEALYQAVQDLDRELDLQELARSVCRRAREVSGARGAVVATWESGLAAGSIVATDGKAVRGLSHARLEGESSFLGLALSNVTALPRDDLTGWAKFPLYVEGVDTKAGSAIIVPLIVDAQPIGGLAVEYERPRRFGEKDFERLRALAAFVAPAFRNAVEFGAVKALSLTDALTGLPNRRATERALASAVAVAERTGSAFAVAIADVDNFKAFNDRYGHDAGDHVLKNVARAIRDGLRPGDHAGRWGGEEFLIVLPSTALDDAAGVVERIRRGVERKRVEWDGRRLQVTVSVGVTAYPELVDRAGAAVPSADAALYKAKHGGRNAVALADPL
ncbi:MAG: sensor domain-containing diguanylate cyclase [Gemmatimonadales bacterium]|jgi:diguanylate cyclase (GGDEF)-like protein